MPADEKKVASLLNALNTIRLAYSIMLSEGKNDPDIEYAIAAIVEAYSNGDFATAGSKIREALKLLKEGGYLKHMHFA